MASQGLRRPSAGNQKLPRTPVPKESPARDEGEHLSDYEPSEVGAEEAPAVPATFRHQKSGALVLFEIVSIPDLALRTLPMNPAFVCCQYLAIKLICRSFSHWSTCLSGFQLFPGCCLCGSLFSDGWGFRPSGYVYWVAHRRLLSFLQVASVVIANGGEVVLGMATRCILLDVA